MNKTIVLIIFIFCNTSLLDNTYSQKSRIVCVNYELLKEQIKIKENYQHQLDDYKRSLDYQINDVIKKIELFEQQTILITKYSNISEKDYKKSQREYRRLNSRLQKLVTKNNQLYVTKVQETMSLLDKKINLAIKKIMKVSHFKMKELTHKQSISGNDCVDITNEVSQYLNI